MAKKISIDIEPDALILVGGCWSIAARDYAAYSAEPDGFLERLAAASHGVTVETYRDWKNNHGAVLCGGRTKSGRFCANVAGPFALHEPREWLAAHRKKLCHVHRGD